MNADSILKSLAELQQNLQDIESAKQQVLNVVSSSEKFSSAASTCEIAFEGLSSTMHKMVANINEMNLNLLSDLTTNIELFKDEVQKLNDVNKQFSAICDDVQNLQILTKSQHSEISQRLDLLDNNIQLITTEICKDNPKLRDLLRKFTGLLPSVPNRRG